MANSNLLKWKGLLQAFLARWKGLGKSKWTLVDLLACSHSRSYVNKPWRRRRDQEEPSLPGRKAHTAKCFSPWLFSSARWNKLEKESPLFLWHLCFTRRNLGTVLHDLQTTALTHLSGQAWARLQKQPLIHACPTFGYMDESKNMDSWLKTQLHDSWKYGSRIFLFRSINKSY